MLVDSWYDAYLGVVVLVRIIDGVMKKGQRVKLISTKAVYQLDRVGVSRPKRVMVDELGPGEIGFFTASIKEVADTRVGDTVIDEKAQGITPLARLPPGAIRGVRRVLPRRCGTLRGPARGHGAAAPQ